MKTVTYRGPDDPRDPTTRFVTADGTRRFPRDVPVNEVPDEVAAELEGVAGHAFEITAGERKVSKAARELAEEKGIDLDSIDGDSITVDDIRDAIEVREAAASNPPAA